MKNEFEHPKFNRKTVHKSRIHSLLLYIFTNNSQFMQIVSMLFAQAENLG